ncbi:MAG: dihydroorotase [Candidatus Heimdallarchaeaceae archaeon]
MVIFSNLRVWDMSKRAFVQQDLDFSQDESTSKLVGNEIDASELIAIPPLVDIHVHFREPGYEHKENIQSGSKAALSSGIFTVLDMPNTNPITDSVETILQKKTLADKQQYVDLLVAAALTEKNYNELDEIDVHADAYKIFMSESFGNLSISYETIEQNLAKLESIESAKPIFFHAEDPVILKQSKSYSTHYRRRPPEAEASAIQQVLSWALEFPKLKFHITHISSGLSLRILELSKHENVTLDTCPRYLYFNQTSEIEEKLKQVNPPLRTSIDSDLLLKSLATGLIDMVSSDHSPHTLEEKLEKSVSGMPGVQELVPSILSLINKGEIEWDRVIESLYTFPSTLLNLPKMDLSQNMIIMNMSDPIEITKNWVKSKSNWSPFENQLFVGQMLYAVKKGRIVFENENFQN